MSKKTIIALCHVAAAAVAMTACVQSSSSVYPTPTAPTVSSDTLPEIPVPMGKQIGTVSGTVYEHTSNGMRPLSNFPIHVQGSREGYKPVSVDVMTNASGRYEVAGLEREYVLVSAGSQSDFFSPCSVRVWLWSDVPMDIHVVSRAQLLASGTPRSMPPFLRPNGYPYIELLSGFVKEKTPDGLRPSVGAIVENLYGDGRSGDPTGMTLTSADGSFALCTYIDDYGQFVRVRKTRYRLSIQPVAYPRKIDFELDPE